MPIDIVRLFYFHNHQKKRQGIAMITNTRPTAPSVLKATRASKRAMMAITSMILLQILSNSGEAGFWCDDVCRVDLVRLPPLMDTCETPVPEIPIVRVLLPDVLTLERNPFAPNETLADFLFTFRRTPGAILKLFLNLKPIEILLSNYPMFRPSIPKLCNLRIKPCSG